MFMFWLGSNQRGMKVFSKQRFSSIHYQWWGGIYREFPLVADEYIVDLNDSTTGKTFPNIFKTENIVEVSEGIKLNFIRNVVVIVNVLSEFFWL